MDFKMLEYGRLKSVNSEKSVEMLDYIPIGSDDELDLTDNEIEDCVTWKKKKLLVSSEDTEFHGDIILPDRLLFETTF